MRIRLAAARREQDDRRRGASLLDRSRGALAPNEMGRKDTVVVNPGETVRLIMRFADYADPEAPYMFHCHILQHEDQGMMGQFVVVPA